jgi:hypothetical protein
VEGRKLRLIIIPACFWRESSCFRRVDVTISEIAPLDEKRVDCRIERWEEPVEAEMPILTDDHAPVEVHVAGIEG